LLQKERLEIEVSFNLSSSASAVQGVRHVANENVMKLERERKSVAAAARRLAAEGLVVDTAGNVSERADDLVAITPTGAALEDLTAEQIAVVDVAGKHVDGDLAATSELNLHLGVYDRYGAGAVVHTHAPMATALSCVLDELPCVHYQLLLLGGPVRVAPYRTFGTPELAEVTLEALEGRMAALMANHGAISWAHDIDTAVKQSLLLEWGCTVYWRASAVGPPRALDEEQRQAVAAAAVERNYGTTRRIDDTH
jgi:L-fuculose-phosphate aldolase